MILMNEYINRENLLKEIQEEIDYDAFFVTEEQNKYINKGLKIAYKDIKSQPAENVFDREQLESVLKVYKNSTYICSVCGNIIFPKVEFENGKVDVTTESCDLRGGLGNQVLKKNVCKSCKDKIGL